MKKIFWAAAAAVSMAYGQKFEVASIHPSQFQSGDGEGGRRTSITPSPDSVTLRNATLRDCLSWAYSVQDWQVASNLGADRFDIAGKAGGPVPVSELRTMLGAMLADRFQLTFHRETKVLPTYALIVTKNGPKLRKSQGDGPGVLQPGKASMSAEHATMSEFTGALSGPLRTPVIDQTGLTDRYDFTMDLTPYFSAAGDTKKDSNGPPDVESIVIQGLRDQLGLTLESRKAPVEILVVDHFSQTPTGN